MYLVIIWSYIHFWPYTFSHVHIWSHTFGHTHIWPHTHLATHTFGHTHTHTFGHTHLVIHIWSYTFGHTHLVTHIWSHRCIWSYIQFWPYRFSHMVSNFTSISTTFNHLNLMNFNVMLGLEKIPRNHKYCILVYVEK